MAEGYENNPNTLLIATEIVADFNNYKSTGCYKGATSVGTLNLPTTGYWLLFVIAYSPLTDIAQLAIDINNGYAYCRVFHDNSTWSAWRRLDNV